MNIAKQNVKNIYPLSPMQEGMLFHFLADRDSLAYFQQISWRINGHLDLALFKSCWNELIRRHDILRTIFIYENTERPLQVVLKERKIDIHLEDIRVFGNDEAKESFMRNFRVDDRAKQFDLSRDILMRVSVLRVEDEAYEVILSHHHIVMDGWSLGILIRESLEIYRALRNKEPPKLPPVKCSFNHYIKWLVKRDSETSKQFWRAYIAGYEHVATPPQTSSIKKESLNSTSQLHLEFYLDDATGLRDLAIRHQVTLNTVLQSLWGIILSRYNSIAEVVFGAVVSGRPSEISDIEQMVGICINTIPVRIRLRPEMTIKKLLQQVQQDAIVCKPHHFYPLARIQAESPQREKLLGTLVVMENYPLEEVFDNSSDIHEFGFTAEISEIFEQTHYDFNIQFWAEDVVRIMISYNSRVYTQDQIHLLKGHIQTVAQAFLKNDAESQIKDIDILTPAELNKILLEFNDTAVPFPSEKTIVDIFEEQVKQTPNHEAVVFEKKTLTYLNLNEKINIIAHYLQNIHRIQPDDRVGLLLDRSEWMIIGILGILKAGGAYVPIDISYPAKRIRYILSDSKSCVVLTDTKMYNNAQAVISEVPVVDITLEAYQSSNDNLGSSIVNPHNLAYVIYTSGTTGKPKGVMIEHHSVVNLAREINRRVYSQYEDKLNITMLASYVFDASVEQIFSTLLHGHTLFVISERMRRDSRAFVHYLLEHKIDVVECTPAFLNLMLAAYGIDKVRNKLKHLTVAGETLSGHLVDAVSSMPGTMRLTNIYGPTECCVDAAIYPIEVQNCQNMSVVPIGKPLANIQIYILDQNNSLLPIGVQGEICLAGEGLARGYLNNEALTQEKFVPCPVQPGKLMYRSGDIGRWLADGNIDFLGRNDDQVKIRGYRIELGEIENNLYRHPSVQGVAVITKEDDTGQRSLCAYIVGAEEISIDDLRTYLNRTLPEYMIPVQFIKLDKLPVTVNGKVDRKALAAMEATGIVLKLGTSYVAPRTEREQRLVEVWQTVLGKERIGIHDNYFSLGGDSIKAIQMLSRLLQNNLKIEIRDVFSYPTISELAPRVIEVNPRHRDEIVWGDVPLTAIQKHFFTEHRLDPHWFNHAVFLHAKQGFQENAVVRVFEAIQTHHDILRVHYRQSNGHWIQEIACVDDIVLDFELVVLREKQHFWETIHSHADLVQASFNLSTGPLMKIVLFRTHDGDRLLIVIHHLLIDGVSWRILLEDFALGYQQAIEGLPIRFAAKTDSFKHWAEEMRRYAAESDSLLKEKSYWAAAAVATESVLPVDYETASNRYRDSKTLSIRFSNQETETLLTEVNQAYTTTTEDILLTALSRALYWRGMTRSLITLEGHGRENILSHMDISRTIGWFTSMYPVLLKLPVERDIGYQIKVIKETLRKVPNKGIGYGILKYLTPADRKKELSFDLEPQIIFNYLGQFDADIGTQLFVVSTENVGEAVNPDAERASELDVSGMILNGELEFSVCYNRNRFKPDTMTEFLNKFQNELREIIRHCQDKETSELTPGDLTYSEISLEELEGIVS